MLAETEGTGTMRQHNLNTQCELSVRRGAAGRAERRLGAEAWLQCTHSFGFIFMRRVLLAFMLVFCMLPCVVFLSFFFERAYCICLDSFGSHKNKLPEVCKCMRQLIRYCWRAFAALPAAAVGVALGTHLPCKRRSHLNTA